MPSVFSRLHTWGATDVVTGADLNAEFNNILNNLDPSGVGSWSQTLTQMRATTAPSESVLAASLSAEIQELRYMLLQLAGANSTYWYSQPTTDLTQLKNVIGGSVANNRLISGTASTNSSRSRLLVPSGSTAAVTLKATTVPFSYAVNGTIYNISADITVGGLSTAAGTNNTMIVNDSTLSGQQRSTWIGEDGSVINVSAMGTNIQSLVGSIGGFITAQNEYFLGYVASSTQITNCFRGFFFNSSNTGVTRSTISNGDTLTLQKLVWFYATTAGQVNVSYTNPKFQYSTPSGTGGDYWYDITNQTWKTFTSNWTAAAATLVGCGLINTANAVAARSFDYYSNVDAYHSMSLQYNTTSSVTAALDDAAISVGANLVRFQYTKPVWDFTANLESGTVSPSTTYWTYVSEQGKTILSTNKPHDFNGTLKGYYHPFEMWRAAGSVNTNGSTAFDTNSMTTLIFHADQQVNLDTPRHLLNAALSVSVSASAMVVSLTRKNGQTPDPINFVQVAFGTTAAGSYNTRYITSSLNITAPNGATLGTQSNMNQYVWVYLMDVNGTVDIALAGDYIVQSGANATAQGIGGAATSQTILYANNNRASSPVRLIGRLLVNEPAAGAWTALPTEIIIDPVPRKTSTEPLSYSPSIVLGSMGGAPNFGFFSWREGRFLNVSGVITNITATGTPAFTLGYNNVNKPSGVVIDTAFLTGTGRIVGSWATSLAGAASGWMIYANGSATEVFTGSSSGGGANALAPAAAAGYNTNGGTIAMTFQVPILGWTSWSPP